MKPLLRSCLIVCLLVCASVAQAESFPGLNWQRASAPADRGWSVTKLAEAKAIAAKLDTAAVMVVHEGVVIEEWGPTALPLQCHSIRKCLLSALYGQAVNEGTIDLDKSLETLKIDDNEPSLTKAEKQAKLRDLLQARSGVYHPALFETASMAAARPKRGSHDPNTFWYYNNWDFNAAGTIFENSTGASLFATFEQRIAKPLGFQDFERKRDTRYVTGADSIHRAYPFRLSARDLARFGLLFLRDGRWRDQQLVPKEWIRESTTSYSTAGKSGGYGYMWWTAVDGKHFPGTTLPDGAFSARGYRGHYLVVIPDWDLIVVHRVNTDQKGTRVTSSQFGKLLASILAARPTGNKHRQQSQVSPDLKGKSANSTVTVAARTDSAKVPPATTQPADEAKDQKGTFDIILRGGAVIDGIAAEQFRADVAISDGRIAKIGDLSQEQSRRVINAAGKIVAPGFIDMHSHAESGLTANNALRRSAPNLITQGITTVVVNQDGGGPESIVDQRQTMQRLGVGLNVVQMIGHGTIRRSVMGRDHQRPATDVELAALRALVKAAMQAGAWGMSAGLEYAPGIWSTPREMEALVGEIAPFGGVYVVHERSSGSRPFWFLPSQHPADQPSMIDNLQELITLADHTGATVVATHIKARGVDFWGSSGQMIKLIEQARADGLAVYADQYAYNTSGSDGRIVLIPGWVFKTEAGNASGASKRQPATPADQLQRVLADDKLAADVRRDIEFEIKRRGGPEQILMLEHPNRNLLGKSLAELTKIFKCNAVDVAIRLQLSGDRKRPGGARLRAFSMSEADVTAFAAQPWVATSSDAGIALPEDGPVHPRFYGAFPRKLRHYAINGKHMSLEQAVQVSTSLPAKILKLKDRGVIRVGAHADIVVFDPQEIRDTADVFEPHQYATGIEFVFVGGHAAVEDSRPNGKLAGQVLQAPGDKLQVGKK